VGEPTTDQGLIQLARFSCIGDVQKDEGCCVPAAIGKLRQLLRGFAPIQPGLSIHANQMPYASVTRGYKAGGFNQAPTGVPAPAGTESYGPEHTGNYELGYKAIWLENKMETTAALFYIDWTNLQLNQNSLPTLNSPVAAEKAAGENA
jgi:hypothetical protein